METLTLLSTMKGSIGEKLSRFSSIITLLGVASVTDRSGVEVGSITQGRDLGLHVTVLYRENENWRTCRRGVSSIERPEKRVYTFWRTGKQ